MLDTVAASPPHLPIEPRSVEFYQGVLTGLDDVVRRSGATQPEAVILAAQLVALYVQTAAPEARKQQAAAARDLIRDTLEAMRLSNAIGAPAQ